ncbi:hypothetical protein AVW11_03810 [Streptomyces amritsarensis]|uniref:Uncharacterized protein n=1 Tax=Streptomyces amritsarensis TaxID=681158 RepID=A0ABX3GBQ3_9ACTN|nr:hypothetical protein [Streptomyces amritsarensis]OLZ72528.1 hypothetical protein AVW11_03810 [Streptomyces amritsarensis]
MARIWCITDSCRDEGGPFVRTPNGPLCEDCHDGDTADARTTPVPPAESGQPPRPDVGAQERGATPDDGQ